MQILHNGIELFPAQYKAFVLTSDGQVKLLNSEADARFMNLSDIEMISPISSQAMSSLKRENAKLKNDIQDLLNICEENGIEVENDNGESVTRPANGNRLSRHHHTETVVYEDDGSDFIGGLAVGAIIGGLMF